MKDDEAPMDLSERGKRETSSIPVTAAAAAFVILLAAGVLIGAVLPSLDIEDTGKDQETQNNEMDLLLQSTIDDLETEDDTFENLPLTTALEIMMQKELDNEDIKPVESQLMEYISFLFNGSNSYRLKASPGSGWEGSVSDVELIWGDTSDIMRSISREVFVSGSGSGKSIFITLDVYTEVKE